MADIAHPHHQTFAGPARQGTNNHRRNQLQANIAMKRTARGLHREGCVSKVQRLRKAGGEGHRGRRLASHDRQQVPPRLRPTQISFVEVKHVGIWSFVKQLFESDHAILAD
jgi:hypothetical protein